jgi:hypothetical protein
MINFALIAGMMLQYGGYGSPPPGSSYQGNSSSGIDTAPFVKLQTECFDKAVGDTERAGQDVRQQRFDTCFSLHDAMVKHATGKLDEKDAAVAKRELDKALAPVEKKYAKKLGITMPEGVK